MDGTVTIRGRGGDGAGLQHSGVECKTRAELSIEHPRPRNLYDCDHGRAADGGSEAHPTNGRSL